MSLDTFVPEVWSKSLLSSLKKSLVIAAPGVVNRDYEGEITEQGDTVRINSISRPTIGTYVLAWSTTRARWAVVSCSGVIEVTPFT